MRPSLNMTASHSRRWPNLPAGFHVYDDVYMDIGAYGRRFTNEQIKMGLLSDMDILLSQIRLNRAHKYIAEHIFRYGRVIVLIRSPTGLPPFLTQTQAYFVVSLVYRLSYKYGLEELLSCEIDAGGIHVANFDIKFAIETSTA